MPPTTTLEQPATTGGLTEDLIEHFASAARATRLQRASLRVAQAGRHRGVESASAT